MSWDAQESRSLLSLVIAVSRRGLSPAGVGGAAVLISALFLIAGLAAVFGTARLILATVMSVVEAVWIPAAAIAFARTTAMSP
jgi:hypothetical protein